jgi:hypothetical protein
LGFEGVIGRYIRVEGAYSLLPNCRAVCANNQFLGGGGELGETTDREVFVVEAGIIVNGVVGLWMCQITY